MKIHNRTNNSFFNIEGIEDVLELKKDIQTLLGVPPNHQKVCTHKWLLQERELQQKNK